MSFLSRIFGRKPAPSRQAPRAPSFPSGGSVSIVDMMRRGGVAIDAKPCGTCGSTALIPEKDWIFHSSLERVATLQSTSRDAGGFCGICNQARCGTHSTFVSLPHDLIDAIGTPGEEGQKRLMQVIFGPRNDKTVTFLACSVCGIPFKFKTRATWDYVQAKLNAYNSILPVEK